MNPMTNVKNIKKLSDLELRRNLKTSWHDQYKDSAWIFVGGLPYDLTEGDVICVFSQYGEVVNINLVRDKGTGKSKGFCFLCYEDQRSTVLAVDNFNGIKLLGRTLRVDHVKDYKPPKDSEKKDSETRRLMEEGCAPNVSVTNIKKEKYDDKDDCIIVEKKPTVVDLVNGKHAKDIKTEPKDKKKKKKEKKSSKEKDRRDKESEKKKKKKTRRRSSSRSSSDDDSSSSSDSSSDDSSTESDSSEERARAKKRKHKQAKKKKSKHQEEESREGEMTASSKRRKLEEKIKALEKALNSVRSGRNKQEQQP